MLIVIRIMNTNQIFIKIFGEFGKNLNSFNEVIWIDCFLFWNSHSCKRQKDKKKIQLQIYMTVLKPGKNKHRLRLFDVKFN